jgi:HD-GYP domain-containing protein (c-di-GMP phosphodiesterase class II)
MARRIRKSRAHLKHWNELVSTVKLMNFAYNNVSIYPATHSEVKDVVARFHAQMRPIFEEQEDLGFGYMDEVLYIEGAMSIEETQNNDMLIERIKACRLKYTTFNKNATPEELLQFFVIVNDAAKNKSHRPIAEMLDEAGIQTISVVEAAAEDEANKNRKGRRSTLYDWYEKVLQSVAAVHKSVLDGAKADLRPLYRLSDDMMATIRTKGFEPFLLLPIMGRTNDPHAAHTVNTAILSGTLGYQYGLNAGQIQTLCVSAFLHDLGRCIIPSDWAKEKSPLSLFEKTVVNQHSSWSFLLATRNSDVPPAVALLAAHHHQNPSKTYEKTGYVPDILHKILNAADEYDLASVSDAVYWKKTDQGRFLRRQLHRRGRWYDSTVLKSLVQLVGYYPLGSFVRLSDGRRGLVVRNDTTHVARPTVYLFEAPPPPPAQKSPSEQGLASLEEEIGPRPVLLDLMELDEKGLGFKNSVAALLPESEGIDARAVIDAKREYLLSHQLLD